MFFERKIRYLDYCKNDEKICGAGFISIEVYTDRVEMHIHVKCRSLQGIIAGKIVMEGPKDTHVIGEMELQDGEGEFKKVFRSTGKAGEEYRVYENALRLSVLLSNQVILRCMIRNPSEELPKDPGCRQEEENPKKSVSRKEEESPKKSVSRKEEEKPKESVSRKEEESPKESVNCKEQGFMADSKWEHLFAIYPHISPFKDAREYLEIEPADFLVLSEEAYRNANNSFLLHGYYNYKHLILTRIHRNGESIYYVGTPGRYYDREKQVAIMFGFESFECAEEPAQKGDFGYYMLRVSI